MPQFATTVVTIPSKILCVCHSSGHDPTAAAHFRPVYGSRPAFSMLPSRHALSPCPAAEGSPTESVVQRCSTFHPDFAFACPQARAVRNFFEEDCPRPWRVAPSCSSQARITDTRPRLRAKILRRQLFEHSVGGLGLPLTIRHAPAALARTTVPPAVVAHCMVPQS